MSLNPIYTEERQRQVLKMSPIKIDAKEGHKGLIAKAIHAHHINLNNRKAFYCYHC